MRYQHAETEERNVVDDAKIQQAIASLDDGIPREGARVKLDQYGGGPDESQIVANKLGFLRLGVEFLKAAYAPTEKETDSVKVEIEYLLTSDSSIGFDWVERREPDEEEPSPPNGFATVVGLSLVGVLLLLVLLGLSVVVRSLFG